MLNSMRYAGVTRAACDVAVGDIGGTTMQYTQNDPKWVQATKVTRSAPGQPYVNVSAYGETFENCRVEWHDPAFNKEKSDVLVQNSQGDWLRVWFYDKDIAPA